MASPARRCILIALLAAGAASPALAAVPDREADLEEIRAEIARIQARLVRLQDEQAGVSGALRRTELQLELQQKRVEEVRAERAIAESRAVESAERVAELEVRLAHSREILRDRLVELYRLGRDGPLRLLFSIRSQRHLLPGIRLLRYLARREAGAVEAYQDSRVRLSFEQDQLEENRREVERLLRHEAQRLASLQLARRRQSSLLAELGRQRESLAARTEVLVDKERKLSAFLDQLYGRNPIPLAGTPMQRFRGVLDWPIRGHVLAPFGPRLDPRYRTRVPHNGVAIATAAGSAVRVIFPGKVLFAAPFEGYGPTVVVNHPSRVFSLYAGLGELRVAPDDVLSLNAVVGLAGERLYFEIRVENRPEDPLAWLR